MDAISKALAMAAAPTQADRDYIQARDRIDETLRPAQVVAAGEMSEPLPCPFCGGEAKVTANNLGLWFVVCDPNNPCGMLVETEKNYPTREEAVALWNTRK